MTLFFFFAQPFWWSSFQNHSMLELRKSYPWQYLFLLSVWYRYALFFLNRCVMVCLPNIKVLFLSWWQSPSLWTFEPRKRKAITISESPLYNGLDLFNIILGYFVIFGNYNFWILWIQHLVVLMFWCFIFILFWYGCKTNQLINYYYYFLGNLIIYQWKFRVSIEILI